MGGRRNVLLVFISPVCNSRISLLKFVMNLTKVSAGAWMVVSSIIAAIIKSFNSVFLKPTKACLITCNRTRHEPNPASTSPWKNPFSATPIASSSSLALENENIMCDWEPYCNVKYGPSVWISGYWFSILANTSRDIRP